MDKITISMVKPIFARFLQVAIIDDRNSKDNTILFKGYFKDIPNELMDLAIDEITTQRRFEDYIVIFIDR